MADLMFSPAERRGIIVFLIICLLLFLSVDGYLSHLQSTRKLDTADREAFITLIKKQEDHDSRSLSKIYGGSINPNQASKAQLLQSGLGEEIAERLIRFREKGAFYNEPADLEKVYGMDSNWLRAPALKLEFNSRPNYENEKRKWADENRILKMEIFDPNTITKQDLERMHLPGSAVKGVISFREKFRAFQKPRDLYKVYNIDSSLARQIIPFVEIANTLEAVVLDALVGPVSINQADTSLLKQLKGVGPYLAKSIVEYRRKLGGFYSLVQLHDLFVIDSNRYANISPQLYCDSSIKKLNINEASELELYTHPYISYKLARNIVEFRERMRLFKKTEELMNIELVDGVLFSKLAPYLDLE